MEIIAIQKSLRLKNIVKYFKIPTGTDVHNVRYWVKVVNFTFSCYFLWSAVNMDIGLR